MSNFKEDLIMLKKGFTKEPHISSKYFLKNFHRIRIYLSSLLTSSERKFKREFELAERAGLLKLTYFDGIPENIRYRMKGDPYEKLVKEHR